MMSFLRLCKVIIQLLKFLYACVISAAFAGCYLSNKTPNQKIKRSSLLQGRPFDFVANNTCLCTIRYGKIKA